MRQWLMDVSLLQGWLPATLFAITVALIAILLVGAIVSIRESGLRPVLVPLAVAAVCGIAGFVLTWLISDVFVVFGVGFGPRVFAWASAGCAGVGFSISHIVMRRRASRVLAVILVVFSLLSSATGINQAYGEYARLGSLFGEDSYVEADLTDMAESDDGLLTIAQWRQAVADQTIKDIPSQGVVNRVDVPATKSGFVARETLVYLPPAALVSEKKPALPVILMMSGQPGSPSHVFDAGDIQNMMDDYAQHHQGLAPIVIAADQLGDAMHNTLCVDSQEYGNVQTYLTQDVVDWVKNNLPAAQDAANWAIAGFSQGATCSMQIGPNYPELFGTIIPTGSEIGPTNGSEEEMIERFFNGDRDAYERQIPINAIRNHAPSTQTLIIGSGEKDTDSVNNIEEMAPVALEAGMHVTAVESLGNAHDWHAVQDTLCYGLAVFGYNTGMGDDEPKLSDYPNLREIEIS